MRAAGNDRRGNFHPYFRDADGEQSMGPPKFNRRAAPSQIMEHAIADRPPRIVVHVARTAGEAKVVHAHAYLLRRDGARLQLVCSERLPESATTGLTLLQLDPTADRLTGAKEWFTPDSAPPYYYELELDPAVSVSGEASSDGDQPARFSS
jgi:hypothetical protein